MSISTAMFLTEAELAARIGVKSEILKGALLALDKEGFPVPDPLFGNRRYWPACKAFLDRRYGLAAPNSSSPGLDGEENWA
ncbi:winged helix-turn-helix domain-containing protein [Rhizobium sp. NFR03]|uniref:winged helix-turn-helix domain-containing protein n=1 Tax=Rhizobium sp. NFR03 TaxID=1566263 RepID=UPI0008B2AC6A|nr:winged helix-turn-helix domain-containing protein [Rhizobium sp. NFR03]SER57052.1 hypothetical protein SAMN03159406_00513 [Rhizobium sp. NFR03]